MKGDFSRNIFDPKKHYSGVRWQQGRPVTDADENEAQEILAYRLETEAQDVIGQSGAPKENPGFGLKGSGAQFSIGHGHFYVDGILVENDAAVNYLSQKELPDPPTVASALSGSALGLVYLDVFKRHVTFHDDDSLRDEALNGVDTTTRLKTTWQVKILPLRSVSLPPAELSALIALAEQVDELEDRIAEETNPVQRAALVRQRNARQRQLDRRAETSNLSCERSYTEWDDLIAPSTGMLEVDTVPGGTASDPCDVPPGGGYTRGENQYYIVQVHSTSANRARAGSTFKWSRDNGSIVAHILAVGSTLTGTVTGKVFDVDSVSRDETLGIHNDDWVEYVDDTHELKGLPGILAQVTNADTNLSRITVDRDITINLNRHPKLRKWEQANIAMNTTSAHILLEGGIQIRFKSGTYNSGDYWQFAARSASGKIDFPPGMQAPHGVDHHYARLGIVTLSGGQLHRLLDCRDVFPALTGISAADVSFDNTNCALPDARTVQEALDTLCLLSGEGGTCTLTVSPGENWWQVFNQVPERGNAEICMEMGEYVLEQSVTVANKGHIKLSGAGKGTRIMAQGSENALTFKNCASVTVRDLAAQGGIARPGGELATAPYVNGVFTFDECGSVTVEHAEFQCASGSELAAACITVAGSASSQLDTISEGAVRIQHCDLRVGHQQAGILAVNATRLRIMDNMIRVGKRPKRLTLERMLENKHYRAAVRDLLVHTVKLEAEPARGAHAVALSSNGQSILFHTPARLARAWTSLMNAIPPRGVQNEREFYWHIKNVADRLLLNRGNYPGVSAEITRPFASWYLNLRQSTRTTGGAGIIVGGVVGQDVHIHHNTIWGMHVGIRAALSRTSQQESPPVRLGNVDIEANEISLLLSPAARLRFGIFVGSCQRVVVQNNNIQVHRFNVTQELPVDGIRIYGVLGEKAVVSQNSLLGTTTGVHIKPFNVAENRLWLAADNIMPSASMILGGGVRDRDNITG